MHNDRIDPDLFHHDNVLCKRALQVLIGHGIAAILDDDGLAGVALQIR